MVGQSHFAARSGRPRRFAHAKPGTATASAAIMTTARLASQAPKMSRKPSTFSVWTMPEIKRPEPNISPHNKDAMIGMAQPAST